MTISSGFYANTVVGQLRAPMVISCWNKDNADPSGYRHFESGIYKPAAKIGNVGGFPAQLESGVALDFGEAIVDSSGFYTETAIITLNLGEVNKNPASYFNLCLGSIGTRFKAFNIKLWLASSGAFAGYSPTFYFLPSKTWDKGRRITSSTPGVQVVPLSAPVSQNIFSKNNNIYISGCYKDLEFTHYVYIVGKFPPGSYSLGEYGGLGSGNFTFKASYDYTDIDANTIGVDVID